MAVWGEGAFAKGLVLDGCPPSDCMDLCGDQPPPVGQKRQREEWESIWYWGMFGGMGLAAVLLYYKPDTRFVRQSKISSDDITDISFIYHMQHSNMGVKRSESTDGSTRRKRRVQAIFIIIDAPNLFHGRHHLSTLPYNSYTSKKYARLNTRRILSSH